MKTLKKLIQLNIVDIIIFCIALGCLIAFFINGTDVSRVLMILIPYIFVAIFRCYYLRAKVEEFKGILKEEGYTFDPDNPDDLMEE